MADRAFPRTAFVGGQEVGRVFVAGQEAEFVFGHGTQILPTLGAEIYGRTEPRTLTESDAFWFEFGFRMDHLLSGNAAAGWTDQGNYFRLEAEQSNDLVNWNMGKFIPSPAGAVVNNGDGTWTYWARSTVPIWWFNVIVDLQLTSNRYGKSITQISVGQIPLALAGYPYAMPADAARLQADLRTLGYAGATVTGTAAPISVGIKNHTQAGTETLQVTMSGSSVTAVRTNFGTLISLDYPYSMPAQRATLQADLRAAGRSGAVVMLYGDVWTITLPDRPAAAPLQRQSEVTFTPGDPYPAWDMFGTYLGEQPVNGFGGTSSNVRPGVGQTQLPEANRQFARLRISPGTRYDPFIS